MIYIHVPFCRSFCTYCDFYSETLCRGRDEGRIAAFASAVCAEAAARASEIRNTAATDTLYIGGGTPSLLPAEVLEKIVREVSAACGKSGYAEFTVEVNPDDISVDYVRALSEMGVNRISMGVQSFDDGVLKWMNRRHNAARALEAVEQIRKVGIGNLSLDLIFGLGTMDGSPLMPDSVLTDTLNTIVGLNPEHISAYQLSIESGSALAELARNGRYSEASDEQCAGQYELICNALQKAGYEHYEISNWARPGFRARHNSAYWTRRPYVGLGPGAHSFDGRTRSWNSESIPWTVQSETIGSQEAREERIMLGLRTSEGVDASEIAKDKLSGKLSSGLLVYTGDRVRIPEEKFFVSDGIISELI